MSQAVIFDLDGTIADTQRFHAQIESEILARFGVSITPEEIARRFAGMTLQQQFDILLGNSVIYDMESVRAEKYFKLGALVSHELQAMPGAVDLIATLSREGFPLAVGSASRKFYVDLVTEALWVKHHFRALVGGDMVPRGKPEPDIFLLAAKLMGVAPHDCLVIGDGNADAEAAHRAGMRCIKLMTPGMMEFHETAMTVSHLGCITPALVRTM